MGKDCGIGEAAYLRTKDLANDPLRRKIYVSRTDPTFADGEEGNVWIKLLSLYNFENDTIGALPVGWDVQFGSGFTVQSVDSTKAVRSTRASIARSALKCTDVGEMTDSDLKVDVYITVKDGIPSLASRVSGAGTSENGYMARLQCNASTPSFDIFKYVNGTGTQLATTGTITVDINKWYTIRLKTTGTTIQAKYWDRSLAEPTTWNLTATDSSHATGYVGIFDAYTGTSYFDNWNIL